MTQNRSHLQFIPAHSLHLLRSNTSQLCTLNGRAIATCSNRLVPTLTPTLAVISLESPVTEVSYGSSCYRAVPMPAELGRSPGPELAGLPGDPITDVSLACSYQWSANALTRRLTFSFALGILLTERRYTCCYHRPGDAPDDFTRGMCRL